VRTRSIYDAIVVGARCAGAPTAMLLARAGARVLLVDRARFPSDSVNGHAIKPAGVACLRRWGLLDAVLATNCPPIVTRQVWVDGRPLPGPPPAADGLPLVAPRRTVLDLTLVEAAAAAGVEVHERTTPAALLRTGDQVSGIEVTGRNGRCHGLSACPLSPFASCASARIERYMRNPSALITTALSTGPHTVVGGAWTGR
jgi:2-polyprenyl-6-methoxyphenol hydroxylase-like FAD-dependent oxidoreductase